MLTQPKSRGLANGSTPKAYVKATKHAEPVLSDIKKKPSRKILEALPYTAESVASIFGLKGHLTDLSEPFSAEITPKMAAALLKSNVGNRPVSYQSVIFLKQEILAGRWVRNGDAIRFAHDGRLLDGQHRLMACVETNIAISTTVMLNLDPASQMTIDGGRKRTNGDNLSLLGESYATSIAATMRWIFLLARGEKNRRSSTAEILMLLDRYPQIRKSVAKAFGNKMKGGHPGMIAAIHFIVCECLDMEKEADAFVEVFATGIPYYKGDPVQVFRERMLSMKMAGKPLVPSKVCDTTVLVWNYFSEKRSQKIFRIPKDEVQIKGFTQGMLDLS